MVRLAEEEFVSFIAGGPSSATIAEWRASPEASDRVGDLIHAEREGTISADERQELDTCLVLEHLVRLIKVRARARARLAAP